MALTELADSKTRSEPDDSHAGAATGLTGDDLVEAELAADEGRPTRRPRARAYVVLAALFIAALAWFVVELVSWMGAKPPPNGDAAVAVARTQALNLMTLNYKTATQDLQRVVDGSTGQMQSEYKQAISGTVSKVTGEKSVSTGSISSAGLVSLKGNTAEVLVAGDATVAFPKSGSTPASRVQVHYRFDIQVQKVNGVWKTSQLNFAGLPNVTELPA